jgi:serine/threonine protein kinase
MNFRKTQKKYDVAIKILLKSQFIKSERDGIDFEKIKSDTIEEAKKMKNIENNTVFDCVVRTYGIVQGKVTEKELKRVSVKKGNFNREDLEKKSLNLFDEDVFGIVMKFERGGSLNDWLYPREVKFVPANNNDSNILKEKLLILLKISRVLAELHSLGVVHADVKPANILLSHHKPPDVRLADFGLSVIQQAKVQGESTLGATYNMKGTPLYSAPEMLINPFDNTFNETVANPSRKTDMYAFGILAWEVLSGERPFLNITSQPTLCSKVHQGVRPPISSLPKETPPIIISMIESCWDKDRSNRKLAVECSSILNHVNTLYFDGKFDVFFCHAWINKPLLSHIYYHLVNRGYRVWYDQNEMGYNIKESIQQGIENSKVVLACVNSVFQTREHCMDELKEARKLNKTVITLSIEDNIHDWATSELLDLCRIPVKEEISSSENSKIQITTETSSLTYLNLGDKVTKLGWTEVNDDPNYSMLYELFVSVEPLFNIFEMNDIYPSLLGISESNQKFKN